MRFLTAEEEFVDNMKNLKGLVSPSRIFHKADFSKTFSLFNFISFSSILNKSFFEDINRFCGILNDAHIFLLVSDPDPIRYMEEFGRYNAISFDLTDGPDDYMSALNDGPHGSCADSIMDSSNRLFLFSDSKNWMLVGDRNTNLTWCCFTDLLTKDLFKKTYRGDFFKDAFSAAEFSFETSGQEIFLGEFDTARKES